MGAPRGHRGINAILLVGSGGEGSLEGAYLRALRRRIPTVDLFDVSAKRAELVGSGIVKRGINRLLLTPASCRVVASGLLRFLQEAKCKYQAVVVFKGADLSRAALNRCRRAARDAIWTNLNPDDPLNTASRGSTNANVRSALDFYDLYCVWTETLAAKLVSHGCRNAAWLPFGYDAEVHYPESQHPKDSDMVSFVGAWDRLREETLLELQGFNIRIYGNGWDRVPRRSWLRKRVFPGNIYGKELRQVMGGSAVCLNLLRPQNLASHNMRTFEIPAMGGLMLTSRSYEQNSYFPEDQACLMFDGAMQLREQVQRALNDSDLSRDVRDAGNGLVGPHSYDQRAAEFLDLLAERK